MQVAVQADGAKIACALEGAVYMGHQVVGQAAECRFEMERYPAIFAQRAYRILAIAARGQCWPMPEGSAASDCVDAADETPQPQPGLAVFQFRRMPALAAEQREAESLVAEQGLSIEHGRGDQRDFRGFQLQGKRMLLVDLFIAPAPGAVKLGYQGLGVLDAHLVNAVLVAVERQQAAVAQQAGGLHGLQHGIRAQPVIRRDVFLGGFHGCIIPAKASAGLG